MRTAEYLLTTECTESTEARQGDKETRRQGDRETRRQGDRETRRQGDKETGRQGDHMKTGDKDKKRNE
jgi:hypothetical protein